jgi:ribosome biogenesis protein BMS1
MWYLQNDDDDEENGGHGGKKGKKKGKKGKKGGGSDSENSDEDEEEGETPEEYLLAAKKLVEAQKERNKHEFSEEGEIARQQHEGFRQGLYVRILLKKVPVEFTANFRAQIPVVLGGLLPHETAMGFISARVKRHRWHRKILKSNDPLIFSIGWRRFQVICFSVALH